MSAKCTDCGRKIATSIRGTELCEGCLEYAGWENTHSDWNHANDPQADSTEGCPVCHPELDPRKPRHAVAGTSRLGMKMVVPVRASALDKAAAVKAQLNGFRGRAEADGANGVTMKLWKGPKDTKIAVEAHWDFAGRWTGGNVNGKKARNASELLRLVAVLVDAE
jgi:hypothetical protein